MEQFIDGLCAILLARNALKTQDVQALKKMFQDHDDLTFEEFLLDQDVVSREDLLTALGEYYGVPAIDIIGQFLDHHLVKMFPLDVMLRYHFVPFERDGDVLIVAAANPSDPALPDVVGTYVSYDVVFMVTFLTDIDDMAEDYYDESLVEEHKELSIDEEHELEKQADEVADILEDEDIRK